MKRTKKRWKFLVWQALSRLKRHSGRCQRCGKIKDPRLLDAHHIVPKSKGNYAMFEPDNIVVMCGFYCHRHWWHGVSTWEEQRDLIKKWIGLDRYYEIKRKTQEVTKYSESDYAEMLERFTGELAKLQGEL